MINNTTKFFFIDEQGTLNNDHEWLLRGGYMIDIHDYLKLNKKIKKLNLDFLKETKEIKWSHISSAIFLKNKNKALNEDILYLDKFSIKELHEYLDSFFKIISDFDIKIVTNVSRKSDLIKVIKRQDSFVKMQLQNLMQRCQFAGQENHFVTILVHENENSSKDDKIKKEVYKEIINSDSFIKDYNLIVDNLFIEFSNLNIGIQIADFIIGAISGTLREYKTSTDIYSQYLRNKVRRSKKDGSSIGYGIVAIPNPKTNPDFSAMLSKVFD
ncbi:MAG: DUF3800 domain-containing protein [Candidatus Pacebacteria bacterium]|nr:DUF3800 domain-containing protein [Candidatus Paceibacterota bacterium]MBP9867095.1 DUF3800 domain-containing protein [Candidatus Paceibacterota bacterium]